MNQIDFADTDVDMGMHDDPMLDVNLAAQFGLGAVPQDNQQHQQQQPQQQQHLNPFGIVNNFPPALVPGVAPLDPSQPQSFPSVEEYAALMGIKLEIPPDDMTVATPSSTTSTPMTPSTPGLNQPFAVGPPPPPPSAASAPPSTAADLSKIQANAAHFEFLYRERGGGLLDDFDGDNITSMTLPAGVGSGLTSSSLFGTAGPSATVPGAYDRTNELAFNDMNRLYDPTSGFPGSANAGAANGTASAANGAATGHLHLQRPALQAPTRLMHPSHHDLGAQTLSPEILSAMIKNNAQSLRNYENLNDEERAALLKEEKSRERNRDHSRKSRLRKKEFVENLKQEVAQLHIYQELCEQCLDLMALVTSEPSAVFLFTSSSYSRVLGYQNHQLIAGQSSFLDHVHPDQVNEVRSIFQRFTTMGETRKFKFRIKAVDGSYFNAETSARMAERGVVCSTRVEKDM